MAGGGDEKIYTAGAHDRPPKGCVMYAARKIDDFPAQAGVDLLDSVTTLVTQEITNAAVTINFTACEPADKRVEPTLTDLALLRDRARAMSQVMLGVVSSMATLAPQDAVDPECRVVLALDSVVQMNLDYRDTLESSAAKCREVVDLNESSKKCLEAGIMDVIAALDTVASSARELIKAIERHDQKVRRNAGESAGTLASAAVAGGSAGVAMFEVVRGLRDRKVFSRASALERIRARRAR